MSYYVLYTVFLLLSCVYLWYRYKYSYWKNKKVRGPKPKLVFGNLFGMFKNQPMADVFQNLYLENKDEPFVGIYMFHKPTLLVNNLDLAKMVLVKDFSHFVDHGFNFNLDTQPLMGHLFNVNGARWKTLRTKVSPAFTSSKMRYMFDTMAACGEEMAKFLEKEASIGAEIDVKDIMARFNTDVIVSCAFGIDSNCFKYPDAEFRIMGKRVFEMDFKRNMYMLMGLYAPGLLKIFDGKIIEDHVSEFFIKTVEATIKHREENNITRNDLMQLLIRLKNNESIEDNKETPTDDIQLTTNEIAALAFGFYGGGFETSSTTLSYIFYELAKNPDIQSKLTKEIDDAIEKNDGKITYDAIHKIPYITQVIEEILRKYPPAPVHFRICTKNYVIPHTNVTIEKDTLVLIPVIGYHMDPKIYPDPEKFDPERFTPENKSARHNQAFIPFGEGPRMCIGNTFAMMQIYIALVNVLRNYEIHMGAVDKYEIDRNSILTSPKNMFVKISNRR